MNRIYQALASVNKFFDVVVSIVVGIFMLAVTIAVFKPVFAGIGVSAVTVAEVAAQRVSFAVTTLLAKNKKEIKKSGSDHIDDAKSKMNGKQDDGWA